MAEITLEALKSFVLKHGNLKIVDVSGNTRMLQPDIPYAYDLVEKADRFWFQGNWYTRREFEALLEQLGPGNPAQSKSP